MGEIANMSLKQQRKKDTHVKYIVNEHCNLCVSVSIPFCRSLSVQTENVFEKTLSLLNVVPVPD